MQPRRVCHDTLPWLISVSLPGSKAPSVTALDAGNYTNFALSERIGGHYSLAFLTTCFFFPLIEFRPPRHTTRSYNHRLGRERQSVFKVAGDRDSGIEMIRGEPNS